VARCYVDGCVDVLAHSGVIDRGCSGCLVCRRAGCTVNGLPVLEVACGHVVVELAGRCSRRFVPTRELVPVNRRQADMRDPAPTKSYKLLSVFRLACYTTTTPPSSLQPCRHQL
jgi:hypothetical protein